MLKKKILRIHIALFIMILLNFISRISLQFSLNQNATFIFKIAFYLSGILLIFCYIKPFKKITIYFSSFLVMPILVVISWLVDRVMGALFASIFLFWIIPDSTISQNDNYIVYSKFQGFMGNGREFKLSEKKIIFFEKEIGFFHLEEQCHPKINKVNKIDNKLELNLNYNTTEKKDTTITLMPVRFLENFIAFF